MENAQHENGIRVFYSCVNGVHSFKSPDVKGLRAISKDLRLAYNAVSIQLANLLDPNGESGVRFEPAVPLEEFMHRLAEAERTRAVISRAVTAEWAMMNQRQMMT